MPEPALVLKRTNQSYLFARDLLIWFSHNARTMPWRVLKGRPNPYHVWISEIMLQQTTVATVIPRFERWLKVFPSITCLAKADEQSVLKQWQGLGYYARARNLLKCAVILINENSGRLPETFQELGKLPGFGPYTSAAVASIAFGVPIPLIDANVRRVMMRLLAIDAPASSSYDKEILTELRLHIPDTDPGHFNQALMELGALVCRSKEPCCNQCPVRKYCLAYKRGIQEIIPRPVLRSIKEIDAVIGIIEHKGRIFIQQRPLKGLLSAMWEFPGGKIEKNDASCRNALKREILEETGLTIKVGKSLGTVTHSYTQFRVKLSAFVCTLDLESEMKPAQKSLWVKPDQLDKYPMPSGSAKVLDKYLSLRNTSYA
ncbi:MAG: A/G-specific adenine glycosylase [Candidatus Omnitrophica bacterium]|nr:A/G-specific adenine glycosylase [Candidatus Omnitrophota bacterium]